MCSFLLARVPSLPGMSVRVWSSIVRFIHLSSTVLTEVNLRKLIGRLVGRGNVSPNELRQSTRQLRVVPAGFVMLRHSCLSQSGSSVCDAAGRERSRSEVREEDGGGPAELRSTDGLRPRCSRRYWEDWANWTGMLALLYGLLWRLLLLLLRVRTALLSALRGRLRSLRVRLWERAVTALLLPPPAGIASGFPGHQKDRSQDADADGRRERWLCDGRALEKLPAHVGLMLAEEEPSYTDIAKLVVWCMAVGVSYVSVYDNHGKPPAPAVIRLSAR